MAESGKASVCKAGVYKEMTRREVLRYLPALSTLSLLGQNPPRPDSFKVYTESPRLLLRPQRLRLLRRERERRSLRWDQFETLWTGNAPFPELGWVQALRFQIADDRESGVRSVAWAVGPADIQRPDDLRQMAIIADWCEPLISGDDKSQLLAKLLARGQSNDPRPVKTLARRESEDLLRPSRCRQLTPDAGQKALEAVFDKFWNGSFIASLRSANSAVPNADAYAMLELMHVVRDNLNFDLRDTFPAWFRQYPLLHLMAHYPSKAVARSRKRVPHTR